MKKVLRTLLVLALAALLAVLCNVIACFVDTPALRQNAAQGIQMLCDQGSQPELVGGFFSSRLDNFTSVLILKTVAYTGPERLSVRAFGGLRTELSAEADADLQTKWETFCTIADGSQSPTGGGLPYARYWHGYLLPLRLLLSVLNLANLQMLLLFAHFALLLLTSLLMVRRGLGALLPGFAAAFFLMMPAATGICLQYAPASLLTLLACCVLLRWNDAVARAIGLPGFFAVVGLLVNYFDLLTFPLTTLGFPLVLCVCLRLRENPGADSPLRVAGHCVACCAAWAVGYAGMWILKWALSVLVFGAQWLINIRDQALLRVSTPHGGAGLSARFSALSANLAILTDKTAYRLLLSGVALLTAVRTFQSARQACRLGGRAFVDYRALALLIPLALPFAWLLVMANHSSDHSYFTYRILACAAVSGYALLAYAIRPVDDA